MPCDIGYRSVAEAEVVADTAEVIEQRTGAPAIDQELMDRLGVDDPAFLAWITELDIEPLLQQALERTGSDVDARVTAGGLVVRGSDPAQLARFARRWQLEVLRVVCELLDYDVAIEARGDGFVLAGEKRGTGGVREYIAIELGRSTSIRFEHFASDDALAVEQRRFRALAQKLGLRVRLAGERRAGQAIPPGTIHPHKHRGKA